MSKPYLDLEQTTRAIESISERIGERFPDSNLYSHSKVLSEFARELENGGSRLVRVQPWIRVISWGGGVLVVGSIIAAASWTIRRATDIDEVTNFLQGADSGVTVIAGAAAGFFMMRSIEQSQVRRRSLALVQRMREIAHVIDMLQLAKSPAAVMLPADPRAHSRPTREALGPTEMFRYLGYCGELAATLGKLAVVVGGWSGDAVVLATVDDVEDLCIDLEKKMLAKLLLLEQLNQRSSGVTSAEGA